MRKTNWKIAVLFSAFLPLFNIIINSQHRVENNYIRLLTNAMVVFLFLMASWFGNFYLNNWFENKKITNPISKITLTLTGNLFLLFIFVLLAVFVLRENSLTVLQDKLTIWLIVFKGAVSIVLYAFCPVRQDAQYKIGCRTGLWTA